MSLHLIRDRLPDEIAGGGDTCGRSLMAAVFYRSGMAAEDTARTLLEGCWSAVGGELRLLDRVTLTGGSTGRLPSRLPALPALLAAVSASTLAAAVLDATRSGQQPAQVFVDAEHVALAARSERHARIGGTTPQDLFASLSRFWQTCDGWLRLHANYPWHRERALRVLSVQEQPSAVAAAILGWRGEELEDALAAAGALGFAVRTPEQWRAHPQGRAVASSPLVHLQARPGPPRPLPAGRGAAGVRILDLTRVIAGPVATRTLAAWGADVLRLDSPDLPEIPAQAVDTLPGKRSANLDFRTADGYARLQELLAAADVLVQGYRPGALARFGLDPHGLAAHHPHLTVVTLSAWGPVGPWATRRGFDSLVQCPTGIAALEGTPQAPGTLPAQVLDHATGYLAAAAALLSLAGVARGEHPQSVQLSLAQTAGWLLSTGITTPERAGDQTPDGYRVTLPGAGQPVQVIAPPGRTAHLTPAWSRTTQLGADHATFLDS